MSDSNQRFVHVLQILDVVMEPEPREEDAIIELDRMEMLPVNKYLEALDTKTRIVISGPIASIEEVREKLIKFLVSTKRLGPKVKDKNLIMELDDGIHPVIYRDRTSHIEPVYRFRRMSEEELKDIREFER